MKKSFFFAFAVAGVLCSCSSEEAIDGGVASVNGGENSEWVPINIGMASNVVTRGTGTVGGTTDEENVWNKQILKVFMFQREFIDGVAKDKFAPVQSSIEGSDLFFDTPLRAPEGNTGEAKDLNGVVRYYPTGDGCYSFWGYHVDDENTVAPALIGELQEETNGDEVEALYYNIGIDGTQDVMVAKAENVAENVPENRRFSAFSARRGLQPELKFKHLLTRLTFEVTSNQEGIKIEKIQVRSKNTGKLVVAYNGEERNQLELNYINEEISLDSDGKPAVDDKDWFTLKERTEGFDELQEIVEPIDITTNDEYKRIGEALLVNPEKEGYELVVTLLQDVETNEDTHEVKQVRYTYNSVTTPSVKIVLTDTENGFLAGNSYKVKLKVYGLEKIVITTTLDKWIEGGNVPIDPESEI